MKIDTWWTISSMRHVCVLLFRNLCKTDMSVQFEFNPFAQITAQLRMDLLTKMWLVNCIVNHTKREKKLTQKNRNRVQTKCLTWSQLCHSYEKSSIARFQSIFGIHLLFKRIFLWMLVSIQPDTKSIQFFFNRFGNSYRHWIHIRPLHTSA